MSESATIATTKVRFLDYDDSVICERRTNTVPRVGETVCFYAASGPFLRTVREIVWDTGRDGSLSVDVRVV